MTNSECITDGPNILAPTTLQGFSRHFQLVLSLAGTITMQAGVAPTTGHSAPSSRSGTT